MANIKSAKKRVEVAQRNADKNKAIRSRVHTEVKKVNAAIEAGDKAEAEAKLASATRELEKAATKGVYHDNMVSRKVSRLAKAVNKM
ncbi:MAG: 30S ribosomal protein S20 [Lachnospiraceae bacterium]|nr:30S ribosomal protein S20 [Lachnospiraceae bacterium]MBR0106352.1 30S ribosomal protein S20 [Lachnospiraceae bacterium]MBR2737549.1 30S ribosomal protein S20 [Lachnospiraceae bacterium]MCR5538553.1 30S ribosomal protein S20 [Lachnospiraceae bacterium]